MAIRLNFVSIQIQSCLLCVFVLLIVFVCVIIIIKRFANYNCSVVCHEIINLKTTINNALVN